MNDGDILFSVDPAGIAIMTINRPAKLNAMTTQMMDVTLPALCQRVASEDAIRVLVITGTGGAFCSGADVESRLTAVNETIVKRPLGGYALPIVRLTKPVIAAVNGVAAGGGMGLALLADFRFASTQARFTTAFVRRGLAADTGMSVTLPRLVGLEKALDLLLTSETIDGEEALRIGLIGHLCAPERLMHDVLSYASKLAAGAPIAQSFIKQAMYAGLHRGFEEQLPFESWGQGICLKTQDFEEGRRAFLEKRPPIFRGH